jgi:MscS family membrane protein
LAGDLRSRLVAVGTPSAHATYDLVRRALKTAAFLAGLLAAMAAVGINITATLAGLGIGGLALAFAAQKTLENVFGGISVLSDRSIVVGDFCRIGDDAGTVESIGLRTTRLRTPERTVVFVPNGSLLTMRVENLARRDKYWIHHTFGLRYETSADQIRTIVARLGEVLVADPQVERSSVRVRFVRYGESSLDIELVAYVFAADYAAYLVTQERLLLACMEVVEQAGSGFAFPSRTVYVAQDSGTGGERTSPDPVNRV